MIGALFLISVVSDAAVVVLLRRLSSTLISNLKLSSGIFLEHKIFILVLFMSVFVHFMPVFLPLQLFHEIHRV